MPSNRKHPSARFKSRIPRPPHPEVRSEPLPWQRPKPASEDPEAPARVQAILQSPSYCEGDRDGDFLNRAETRGIRLQIDYLKPQILLEAQGIRETIVVLGSTRIPEPLAAHARVEALTTALAATPGDSALRRRLETAESLLAKSRYYEVAREFGRLVGEAGDHGSGRGLVVMTGGGPGIMEAANRGAHDAGAKSVGLNINLPHEQFPNPYVTPDLCFKFHYFALRKLHFLLRARALVAFPGGFGTFDELFEALTLVQTREIKPMPIVLVGEDYWRRAVNIDFLVAEGVIESEDRDLFWYAETAAEIWEGIQHWYAASGQALVPPQ